jgi:glutathione reductase (NADPH)
MTSSFDLIVIGTGTAASTVAEECREAGWGVAIIDSRPYGGTCALRGCDPKKVLVGVAQVMDWVRRMEGKGVHADQFSIRWPDLMRFKHSFTDPVSRQRGEGFQKASIATFHGRARFAGRTSIEVGSDTLEALHIVIAAGAKPATLNIPGENLLITSEQFLDLEKLPSSLIFVGGGYISFEFAHLAARAGSRVTMLHRGRHPLPGFDPDLVSRLLQTTRELEIDLQLEAQVEGLESVAGGVIVTASVQGEKRTFTAEMAVHGAGRVPEIDDLDLETGEVERERHGVKVNEYLQSVSNPVVYAAGDAAASGGLPLTPVAGYEGRIVAANLLNGNHLKTNYVGVPTVVFTVPPLARVGLLEENARKLNLRFKTQQADTSGWYSSRRVGERYSAFKVLIEENTDRILGAHLLGSEADETINLFALAVRFGITASQLRDMIFSYPTHASDIPYML